MYQPVLTDAKDIIDRYRSVLANPQYFDGLRKVQDSLRNASMALKAAAEAMQDFRIRPADWAAVAEMPGDLTADCQGYRFDLIRRMYLDSNAYDDLAFAIDVCADPNGRHKNARDKRIPRSVYDNATYELILRFEALTKKRVKSPEALHEGSPKQNSTVFIAECLKEIDSSLDPASAVTCIKNALNSRSSPFRDVRAGEEPVAIPLPSPIP